MAVTVKNRNRKKGMVSYGLWEKGKRLTWFTEPQIAEIKAGKLDYRKLFQTEYSKALPIPENDFEQPPAFEETMQSIARELGVDINKMITK